MNENINLSKILKGHENEMFYSPVFGNLRFTCVIYPFVRFKTVEGLCWDIKSDGKLYSNSDELCVFPSKDQRDWNKWIEEQNSKIPKTWSKLIQTDKFSLNLIEIDDNGSGHTSTSTPIEKSALALLKIYQLIEVGYGGNVTFDYIRKMPTYEKVWSIYYNFNVKRFETKCSVESIDNTILFHTKEQAEEFLKYPENIQLLKDYFMI